jgi:hypothetical protein
MTHDDPALGQATADLRQRQIRLGFHQSKQKVSVFQQLRMTIAAHRLGINGAVLFHQLGPSDCARDADPKPRRCGVAGQPFSHPANHTNPQVPIQRFRHADWPPAQ